MIKISDVTKSFNNTVALDNISLNIESGELYGLIGPDGSGKTTLFRLLTTLLYPDKGSLSVDGFDTIKDYAQIRKIVGYMPGKFSLYQDLTVEDNLNFFASVFNIRLNDNLDSVNDIWKMLAPFKDRRAGRLSGGMKQKLALCCALIHQPKVLFLDEPTTGVDPVSRYEFWIMLKKFNSEGITIVVSTPYMSEAAECSKISLIRNGKIIQTDTPRNLADKFGGKDSMIKDGIEQCFLQLNDFKSESL